MQELNATINILAETAAKVKEVSDQLNEDMKFYCVKGTQQTGAYFYTFSRAFINSLICARIFLRLISA